MEKAESLVVTWCDGGATDSLFTSATLAFMTSLPQTVTNIDQFGINQVIGGQIARQRQDAIRNFENMNCDWLLWLDSDIVITPQAFQLLWDNRDPIKRPLISGVYFITYEMNEPLPAPIPCIFMDNEKGGTQPIHPLPNNELLPIDLAGLGFTLMHKSVAHKLREAYGETTFQIQIDKQHVSEDVAFFRKVKEIGIQPYAHTGAIVSHVKRFLLEQNYYNLWWNVIAPMREAQEKQQEV